MPVGVFGVPSVYTTLCVHLIKGLLAQANGSCEALRVATSRDLKGSWGASGAQNTLFFHDVPEPELVEFLIGEKIPLIAFLGSLEACSRELVRGWGMDPLNAVRHTSLSMSALEEVIIASDVFVIRNRDGQSIEIRQLATKLAAYLGLSLQAFQIDHIIRNLSLRSASDGNFYLEDQLERSTQLAGCPQKAGEAQLPADLISSLRGYNSILELHPVSQVNWPRELFLTENSNKTALGEPVNLVGPARVVVYGPYLGLPSGKWTATLTFFVSDNISGNKILFDVSQNYLQHILTEGESELPAHGTYSCDMNFSVANPHLPIEVRLVTKQGAIEGELLFLGADLRRR